MFLFAIKALVPCGSVLSTVRSDFTVKSLSISVQSNQSLIIILHSRERPISHSVKYTVHEVALCPFHYNSSYLKRNAKKPNRFVKANNKIQVSVILMSFWKWNKTTTENSKGTRAHWHSNIANKEKNNNNRPIRNLTDKKSIRLYASNVKTKYF